MDGLEDARVGYPCLYPACKERRKYPMQLVEHVETDHTNREVLERMVIRDKLGNILALPPHCIFRYFPDVGLPPEKVQEIMESITAKDRSHDPLLSSASQTPHTLPLSLPSTPGSFSDVLNQGVGGGYLATQPSLHAPRPIPSSSMLNDLLTNPTGMSNPDNRNLMQLLALRQRMLQQQSLAPPPSVAPQENQEPNIVVAGLRQLLAAPHTPLLQQLVQASPRMEKQGIFSTGGLASIKAEPLPCISPAPSTTVSCATPPAPSPDSGRGSESSMEESIDQNASLTQGSCSGSSLQSNPDENSNDSWTQREDYSVEAIVAFSRNGVGKRPKSTSSESDKPYACPVPGCQKSYKNMNGIKYHARCAHRTRKNHRCTCNKKYSSEEKYLAHMVKCLKGRKESASAPPPAAATSLPAAAQTSASVAATPPTTTTTTPTLHQLLKTRSSTAAATKNTTALPSLPSVFSPGRTSLLHTLLDG